MVGFEGYIRQTHFDGFVRDELRYVVHGNGLRHVAGQLYAKRVGMSSLLFFAPKMAKKKSLLSRHLAKLGKKGGKARLETMTEEERKESARKAALARWAKKKTNLG